MPIPVIDGPYGGCLLVTSAIIVSTVGIGVAQSLVQSEVIPMAQLIFVKNVRYLTLVFS